MSYWGADRYAVIRNADGYTVIDKKEGNRPLFTTFTRQRAWRFKGQMERRNEERKSREDQA